MYTFIILTMQVCVCSIAAVQNEPNEQTNIQTHQEKVNHMIFLNVYIDMYSYVFTSIYL